MSNRAAERNRRLRRRISITAVLDEFFFVFAGIAAVWLAWLLLTESFHLGGRGLDRVGQGEDGGAGLFRKLFALGRYF